MKVYKQDIWMSRLLTQGSYIVIPTNGDINKKGECVMGRGLALAAKLAFPDIPKLIAFNLMCSGNHVFRYEKPIKFFSFPVKVHWHETAKQYLIQRSCQELLNLITFEDIIFIPKVGCGNGGLNWETQVKPIFEQEFTDKHLITIADQN